jgi:very-short-patch-repair endonuclease
MILTTEIKIKIQGRNIHYYESLGYNIKVKDIITIPIEHLPKTSHEKILVKCDNCGNEKYCQNIAYNRYLSNSKDNEYLCYMCNDKNRKRTLLEKYGVDALIKNEDINSKRKKTMVEKFGFEHQCQADEIKQKIASTNLERYGVEHPSQSKVFRNKINKTNLEKYGNINSLINDKTLEKTLCTMLEKYGVKYSTQNNEILNKILISVEKKRIQQALENNKDLIDIDYKNSTFIVNCDQHKNHTFSILPHLYYDRKKHNIPICTVCNPINMKISGSELMILNFIKENYDKEIILNSRKIIKPYELDIYIPDLKLAIEYNGLFWHSDKYKDKNYHLNKTELCEHNDIQLLHIWEDDWVFNQDKVKSIILDKIDANKKIDSNLCEIKELDISEIINFLDINHIYGYSYSDINIGLFYKNELVSLMTFKENEIVRFCNKLNFDIINSELKIFNYYCSKYNPTEISTVVNRSYADDFPIKLGFPNIEYSNPNCYYVNNFMKFENMITDNDLKIYDSGNIIYNKII